MCMTNSMRLVEPRHVDTMRVWPYSSPPDSIPVVKRWKFIRYVGIGRRTYFNRSSDPEFADVWNLSHGDSAVVDHGYHVFTYKPRFRLEGTLVEVEVAGIIARGVGDGFGNEVGIETYLWMRFPRKGAR